VRFLGSSDPAVHSNGTENSDKVICEDHVESVASMYRAIRSDV
jgi:hypothetical protein